MKDNITCNVSFIISEEGEDIFAMRITLGS